MSGLGVIKSIQQGVPGRCALTSGMPLSYPESTRDAMPVAARARRAYRRRRGLARRRSNAGDLGKRGSLDWSTVRAKNTATWHKLRSPLGACWDPEGVTFAIHSKRASRVLLELFHTPCGKGARRRFVLRRGDDDTFRGLIADVPPGALYGFRCWGPNWPYEAAWRPGGSIAGFIADVDNEGNRFNPNKLLIDPYARELSHDRENAETRSHGHHAAMYGSGPALYAGFGSPPCVQRVFDTAPWAPKSVVVHDTTSSGTKPRINQKDAVIYEVHVRGLTKHPSASRLRALLEQYPKFAEVVDVPEAYRGTYRGAAMMAPYLKALGVTTVEFLPVQEAANDLNTDELCADRTELEAPHGNYWGYMTYGFFAPDRRYAYDKTWGGPTREFKAMVKAFHDAGLEVYLDVVYNHTGEGGLWNDDPLTAEVLCFRGLDNASYYALTGEGKRRYWESTGCGNNLDCSNPAVQKLICDSLHYWTTEMGVDGFRFDLATVLGRDQALDYQFRGGAELLENIAEFAQRHDVEVIAEAWDLEDYTVGAFPKGWAEWNGRYRDTVRQFLRGDPGLTHRFLEVINGDYELFRDQGGPHKSVNFVVAHDGFTLLDLVSYDQKNNHERWPFGPSDGGSDQNYSWDSQGDHALRRQRMRNFLTILMFSRGVPMLLGGDELPRTQNGNNNPYKIDSAGMWLNFAALATCAPTQVPTEASGRYHDNFGAHRSEHGGNGWFRFVHFLLQMRAAHIALRQDTYGDFEIGTGNDVSMLFYNPRGDLGLIEGDLALQWYIDGSAVGDCDFLLLVNMGAAAVTFSFADLGRGGPWRRIIDTAAWAESSDNLWQYGSVATIDSGTYGLAGQSVAVLQRHAVED